MDELFLSLTADQYKLLEESLLISKIVEALKELSPETRLNIFSHFCTYCGDDNPRCRCWDDE